MAATADGYSRPMPGPIYTFMLRMLRRDPDSIPMERLGEYIREFAGLLGTENRPVFKGVKKASTGLRAYVPGDRVQHARASIASARLAPSGRPGRHLQKLELMLAEDMVAETEILDRAGAVIYVIHGAVLAPGQTDRLFQEASVDGVVTGLVGADDTMHLHLRDHFDRDLRLVVRDEGLARGLLSRFRTGSVRVRVRGTWVRSENGWAPESNKCAVLGFEVLDEAPLSVVFESFANVDGNGWGEAKDPLALWETIRGLQ